VNYYIHNQWLHNPAGKESVILVPSHPHHLPLRYMLREVYERYGRPLFVSETGIEDDVRPAWLRYISGEVRAAIRLGVPVEGICLYPILNHPGWEDDRHCRNGVWDYADAGGGRDAYPPLMDELRHQQEEFARLFAGRATAEEPLDLSTLDLMARKMDEMTTQSREAEK
jgi:hypothetical protein